MAGSPLRLHAANTGLLLLNLQERPLAALPPDARERCRRNVEHLLEGARLFDLPVVVGEQYPPGLGRTEAALRRLLDALPRAPVHLQTMELDLTLEPGFDEVLDELFDGGEAPLRTLLVCGLEAHLGVYQTVRSLGGSGFHVHVPWDATAARDPAQLDVARGLWDRAGAVVTSTETVLFDLVGRATDPRFDELVRLVHLPPDPPEA